MGRSTTLKPSYLQAFRQRNAYQTLNTKLSTAPSLMMYPLPSPRIFPAQAFMAQPLGIGHARPNRHQNGNCLFTAVPKLCHN